MQTLICDIMVKNQNEAYRRAAKYYLMRTLQLPVNSWIWVYNPRTSPPDGDNLDNRKLSIQWAGPYIYEDRTNDESGQIIRRFLVHGSKVRLCQLGGQPEEDNRQWTVRPGMSPDFPDSEVSSPLYCTAEQHGARERETESVLPTAVTTDRSTG